MSNERAMGCSRVGVRSFASLIAVVPGGATQGSIALTEIAARARL